MGVQIGDFPQVVGVCGIGQVGGQSSLQWIIDLNLYVIDGWLRILMEFFVDSDSVWELNRRQGRQMLDDNIW